MTARSPKKKKVVLQSNSEPSGSAPVVIRAEPSSREDWKKQWMEENNATEADFEEHFNKPAEEMGVGADGIFSLCIGATQRRR